MCDRSENRRGANHFRLLCFLGELISIRICQAAIVCLGVWLALSAAAQSIQPIYSFTGGNGAFPEAGLTLGPDGNLYGTTELGGSINRGTVFRFTIGGPLTTLATFVISNGSEPAAQLIVGPDGSFYGTASEGGSGGLGTVFRITTNGAVTTLVNFAITNGAYPYAGLAMDQNGNFYGTTEEGGGAGYGTVFRVATNGTFATLASFDGFNGMYPLYAPLIMGPDGNFYGTTQGGGSSGVGTLFRITTKGTLTTLASFAFANGSVPQAGMTVGPDGNLYGTTSRGGTGAYGTVFRLTTNGTLTTLANFNLTNGAFPSQLTLGPDGNFYGTATAGGSIDDGTVFKISTNGSLTILASFTDATGSEPLGSLTLGPDGNFYGTTTHGGSANEGVTYRLNLPPSIITEPSNQTVFAESDVTFSVGLFGTAPFAYEWLYNGTPIAGATSSTLTIPDAMPSGSGNYQVIVTNTWGSVTSSVATLSVIPIPPMITNPPASESVLYGGTAAFVVGATGTPPLAYQWLFGSIPIAGATNSTLSIPDVTLSSAGNYQVIVTNPWGSVTSSVATLSVIPVPPMITNQPVNQSVRIGGTATFSVGATGTPPLAYQWYFTHTPSAPGQALHAGGGVQRQEPLPGGTNASLSFGPVHPDREGNYQVIVTSPYGSATSDVASLTVLRRPNLYGLSNSGSGITTLLLASTPGSTNRLWATTNLSLPFAQWQPIATNVADVTGLFQFIDTNAGNAPAKFYILSSP